MLPKIKPVSVAPPEKSSGSNVNINTAHGQGKFGEVFDLGLENPILERLIEVTI